MKAVSRGEWQQGSDQFCPCAVAGYYGSEMPLHAAEMRAMAAASFAGVEISGRETLSPHTCPTEILVPIIDRV